MFFDEMSTVAATSAIGAGGAGGEGGVTMSVGRGSATSTGGASGGGGGPCVVADIHAGQWSAFFMKQAGTPFLWWHDFIHVNNYYPHYQGVARFMSDIDPRGKGFVDRDIIADPLQLLPFTAPGFPLVAPNRSSIVEGLSTGNSRELYGWIYVRFKVHAYPEANPYNEKVAGLKLQFDNRRMAPGVYRLEFFDTMTGKILQAQTVAVDANGRLPEIIIPAFSVDIAFKLRPSMVGNDYYNRQEQK